MPDAAAPRQGPKPLALAAILTLCAGALTGLALARPTPMTAANAILFWAWAATALRFAFLRTDHRVCAACGAIDPLHLPDGSCAACAAPVNRSFPGLVPTPKPRDERKPTSW
ncbi:MAG: hypothetical protein QOJ26_540 [Thermoplasmata archaeon]|jgi:hypothetical protein|nr:hypothetical protein [Thermoplasmata archaeon]MEA3165674.1 hypothetical protein [Thermoplasmata archaeon]